MSTKNNPMNSFMGRAVIRTVVLFAVSFIKIKSFTRYITGSAALALAPTHVKTLSEKYPVLRGLAASAPGIHGSHRGGGSTFGPENTLYTYRKSIHDCKTQILEIDLHLTRDGHVVLHHDTTLDIPVQDGNGFIADMTLAQLKAVDMGHGFTTDGGKTFPLRNQGIVIPTLHEVLDEFMKVEGLVFFFDFKSPLAVDPALAIIKERGIAERVILGAVSYAINQDIMAKKPAIIPIAADASTMMTVYKQFLWGNLDALDIQHDILGFIMDPVMENMLTKELFDAIHRKGKWLALFGASLNNAATQKKMVDLGVDILLCDRPDVFRETLDARPVISLS